jgi:hypothetical protein
MPLRCVSSKGLPGVSSVRSTKTSWRHPPQGELEPIANGLVFGGIRDEYPHLRSPSLLVHAARARG